MRRILKYLINGTQILISLRSEIAKLQREFFEWPPLSLKRNVTSAQQRAKSCDECLKMCHYTAQTH